MKKVPALLFFGIVAFVTSCSNKDDDGPEVVTGTPVETETPNTAYKPAFSGQTRVGSIVTSASYSTNVVTSSLSSPWGIIGLPDGSLLVTEKSGQIKRVNAGVVSNPILGIPQVNDAGQGGLLGICIDPDFAQNRMIYWAFSETVSGGTITSVAKGKLSSNNTAIEGATVIYKSSTPFQGDLHYGGRVIFDKQGQLLVSIGERSDLQTRPLAQSMTSSLGKVIRITTDGTPAANNPVWEQDNALPEIYSSGHRNPQGLALHPVTGDVWQSEHGPRGGDELNRLEGGNNYGWPTITYGIEYSGEPIGDAIQQLAGMEQPTYYWDPVISPSGMSFYKGNRISEWENDLFIASLSAQHIVRLKFDGTKVVGEERLLEGQGQRFRDITQGFDGALYAITDQGRLYKIDKQ